MDKIFFIIHYIMVIVVKGVMQGIACLLIEFFSVHMHQFFTKRAALISINTVFDYSFVVLG